MSNSAMSEPTADQRDELFSALSSVGGRAVVRIVSERSPNRIEKSDIAFRLAAVIADIRLADVSDVDHKRALASLHHRLLPQLTDVGLLEETNDGSIEVTDHWAFDGRGFEDLLPISDEDDPDVRDTIFEALADKRRRTILSVLSNQYHPVATETLARDVAAREADSTEREISERRVEDVFTSLVHVHLPLLNEATLISYDSVDDRVSYEGHPAVRAEWLRSAYRSTGSDSGVATSDTDLANIRTLEDRKSIITTGQSLCEVAEDELFLLFAKSELLEEGCYRRIEDAVDRGVDVYLGSRDPRIRDLVRERIPEVVLWEPQFDLLTLAPEGESVVRLVFADREAVMIGTLQRSAQDDRTAEAAILGDGPHNGLVVMMRQMLASRLERIDAQSDDYRLQFPL
ncbi:DUF7344 domain-containing protein [Natrinema halophilum]|uniref:DUF7344 domain-containing protein n=1 Tax=Natrinema halophilum TaxID=1699371 RepID=A0A7D5GJB2_9EURY|nr:hypothetical protein [Natrinema halophilum]QLG47692.1 hypothetical protein HYG82_01935 [Natrinema halophilum]